MRYAKVLLVVTRCATALAAFVPRSQHSEETSVLEVTLFSSTTGVAAELVATIKNTGATDLNLLKVGTLLDEALPVQKLSVADESGVQVSFKGIHTSIQPDALKPEHFRLLKASESIDVVISAAALHDFTKSGIYTFSATGLMPVAQAGSTELAGPAISFSSNTISIDVDAGLAAAVTKAITFKGLQERTNIRDGCNTTELAASTLALSNCESLALAAAADAADPSSARFVEYFGTNSSETRQIVHDRLTAAAKECSTTDSGISTYYCYDYYRVCEIDGPLNAYTAWDMDIVVMCPLFYNTLPPLPPACHKQSQATTTIHEMTHCEEVYSPHTNDYVYGYNESVALPPERSLNNADNYSLYAGAVHLKC